MHDQFRDDEAAEFRELQKELEATAKNCRILQFKLRKLERRNEQAEADRQQVHNASRYKLTNQIQNLKSNETTAPGIVSFFSLDPCQLSRPTSTPKKMYSWSAVKSIWYF